MTPLKQEDRFTQLLHQLKKLHDKKSHDYAKNEDPLSNLRECEKMGVPAWVGVLIRMGDKISRLQQLTRKKPKVKESIRDNLMDIAVYSLLAIILYEERGTA